VQQAYVGYVFGDSTSGQTAIYGVGLTGIPVINVNNNCATGSTALYLARQAVESGAVECAIALGFEQMVPGALKGAYTDRPGPMERFARVMNDVQGFDDQAPRAAVLRRCRPCLYEGIRHSARDLRAYLRESPPARGAQSVRRIPQHRHAGRSNGLPEGVRSADASACCPPTCGAAAAILCTEAFARKHGLDTRVAIAAQAMTTDRNSTFDEGDMRKVVGYDMTHAAATQVYERAGIGPGDVDVVELHDCFTANELITYEGLGLTPLAPPRSSSSTATTRTVAVW
jgi:acetyl-CoA acetyltransferase